MNRIFNKLNAVLLAGMLGGILVVGLGSGIAFAEYMSFEYDDSSLAANSTHETEEFTYEMAADERVYAPAGKTTIDKDIPVGTVMISVEYDPYTMEVERNFGTAYDATHIEVLCVNVVDGFERFMQNKDILLQGLKDGKIVAIPGDYYFEVSVAVNPADQDRVFTDLESLRRTIESEANSRAGNPVR
ncbi:MAG: hypothetical protein IKL97_04375 [Eggerthellaceae bacterium]|nr:hypothetical protein [Eggerthellaceae bacterium]